jgi:hypothetical protein
MKPSDLGYLVNAARQGIGVSDLSKVTILRGKA